MDLIDYLTESWPVVAGLTLLVLAVLFFTALTAWKLCKRAYNDLLDAAEGRAVLAEERAVLANERALLSDERAEMLRDKLESMRPDIFDAKIDEIVTHIHDAEYTRINGIIGQLNDIKIGVTPQETAVYAQEETPVAEQAEFETMSGVITEPEQDVSMTQGAEQIAPDEARERILEAMEAEIAGSAKEEPALA